MIDIITARFERELNSFKGDDQKGCCMGEIAAYVISRCKADPTLCSKVLDGDNKDLDTIADKFMDAAKPLRQKSPAEILTYMSSGELEHMADEYFGIADNKPAAAPTAAKRRFKAISLDDD